MSNEQTVADLRFAADYLAMSKRNEVADRLDRLADEWEQRQAVMTERAIADAIVHIVCGCQPPFHVRGYPECATARAVALAVLALTEPVQPVSFGRPHTHRGTTNIYSGDEDENCRICHPLTTPDQPGTEGEG